jgi:hypothetical protein
MPRLFEGILKWRYNQWIPIDIPIEVLQDVPEEQTVPHRIDFTSVPNIPDRISAHSFLSYSVKFVRHHVVTILGNDSLAVQTFCDVGLDKPKVVELDGYQVVFTVRCYCIKLLLEQDESTIQQAMEQLRSNPVLFTEFVLILRTFQ